MNKPIYNDASEDEQKGDEEQRQGYSGNFDPDDIKDIYDDDYFMDDEEEEKRKLKATENYEEAIYELNEWLDHLWLENKELVVSILAALVQATKDQAKNQGLPKSYKTNLRKIAQYCNKLK